MNSRAESRLRQGRCACAEVRRYAAVRMIRAFYAIQTHEGLTLIRFCG